MHLESVYNDSGIYLLRFISTKELALLKTMRVSSESIHYTVRFFSNGIVKYSARDTAGLGVSVTPAIINSVFKLFGTELELHDTVITLNYVVCGILESEYKKLSEKFKIDTVCKQLSGKYGRSLSCYY